MRTHLSSMLRALYESGAAPSIRLPRKHVFLITDRYAVDAKSVLGKFIDDVLQIIRGPNGDANQGASHRGRTRHRVGRSLPSKLVFGKRDGKAATGFGLACSRGRRACYLSDVDRKNCVLPMTYTRNAAPPAELQTPAGGSQHLARKYLQPVVALRHLGGWKVC
jgi:hypothetical protein